MKRNENIWSAIGFCDIQATVNKPIIPDEWLKALAARVDSDGPQTVEVDGERRLTVLAESDYRRLSERKKTFKEWLLSGPRFDDLEIEREPSPGRDFSF
jgi:hypothetical protein